MAEKYTFAKGWVDFPAYLAAAYYQKGNLEKMWKCWQEYLHQFEKKINNGKPADTQAALRWMIDVNPYKRDTRLKPFWEYLSDGEQNLNPVSPGQPSINENRFRMKDGLWSISFAGKQVQMSDLKGLHDLKWLLSTPNRGIHCTELIGVKVIEGGEPVFDQKAKESYKLRILELQKELEEAETRNDIGRATILQEEYEKLIDHLSKSVGKGGKARKVSSSIEKARSAVTWRIRSAISKIEQAHPSLGKHLSNSIQTGTFCSYEPETEMEWVV